MQDAPSAGAVRDQTDGSTGPWGASALRGRAACGSSGTAPAFCVCPRPGAPLGCQGSPLRALPGVPCSPAGWEQGVTNCGHIPVPRAAAVSGTPGSAVAPDQAARSEERAVSSATLSAGNPRLRLPANREQKESCRVNILADSNLPLFPFLFPRLCVRSASSRRAASRGCRSWPRAACGTPAFPGGFGQPVPARSPRHG